MATLNNQRLRERQAEVANTIQSAIDEVQSARQVLLADNINSADGEAVSVEEAMRLLSDDDRG